MIRSSAVSILFSVLLMSCSQSIEGDLNVFGGDPDTTISVGGSSSFESEEDLYAQGKALYGAQCASCHGPEGTGDPGSSILGAIRNETAIELTRNAMPMGDAMACGIDCSVATIAWVARVNDIELNIDLASNPSSGTGDGDLVNNPGNGGNNGSSSKPEIDLDLFVAEDSFIHRKFPTSNFGRDDVLSTKFANVEKSGSRIALLKFRLPEIESQDFKAELFYYFASENSDSSTANANVSLVENSWSEMEVTWNNAPTARYEVSNKAFETYANKAGSWEIIDVTDAVKTMVEEGEDTISFSVRNNSRHIINISSREYHNAVTGAVLSIKSNGDSDDSNGSGSSNDSSGNNDSGNNDSGNNDSGNNDSGNDNQTPATGQLENGASQYASQCAGCHGDIGDGKPRGSSIVSTLFDDNYVSIIETTMPFGSAGSCDVNCSEDITAWLRTLHDQSNVGNDSGSDNNSDSDSDNNDSSSDNNNSDTDNNGSGNNSGDLDTSSVITATDSILLNRLYKASMNLNSEVPRQNWVNMVKSNGESGLASAIDQMMNEDSFYQRLKEIYSPNLQGNGKVSDKYVNTFGGDDEWYESLNNSDKEKFAKEASRMSLGDSGIELVSYVVKNNKPFTEILTADYLVLNYYGARMLGLLDQVNFTRISNPEYSDLPYSPAEFKKVRSPDVPMAGVLTTNPFMDKYPTTGTNVNRHRSYNVYKLFLDTDILEISGSRVEADDIAVDHPTMNSPTCTGCHTVMDPVASTFRHWQRGSERRTRYQDAKWSQDDILEPGFNGQKMPASESAPLQWLVPKITSDRRFALATVKTLFQEITGHSVLAYPSEMSAQIEFQRYEHQQLVINEMADNFIRLNYNLKTLIKALLTSDYFNGEAFVGGTSQLLSAERLKRKLLVTTGDNSFSGSSVLLNGDVYAGDQPNGIMVLINQYTASYISCESIGKDLTKSYSNRLLLPNFVTNQSLENSNGSKNTQAHDAVKADLKNLMWVLWGQNVNTNDAGLNELYESYLDIVRLGSEDQDTSNLSNSCRYTDPASKQKISKDSDFRVRGWISTLNLMIDDYRYLYE